MILKIRHSTWKLKRNLKMNEVYIRNKKELEDIIIAKQLSDDTVEKFEDQTKIIMKKERAWIIHDSI